VIFFTPAVVKLAVHCALALASPAAAHPAMTLPPLLKVTVPVGALPATLAVKVTGVPTVTGEALVAITRNVAAAVTLTPPASVAADGALTASPEYSAVIAIVPAARNAVSQSALPPMTGSAPQPLIVTPPLAKRTVPVGLDPVTEAVKTTGTPTGTAGALVASSRTVDASVTTAPPDSTPLAGRFAPSPE
jgi:hypothetical protein